MWHQYKIYIHDTKSFHVTVMIFTSYAYSFIYIYIQATIIVLLQIINIQKRFNFTH